MPIDRPTFHESWYRVASLRPRLRGVVQTYRQEHRGRLWHVLRDPGNNQFFRVDESGYRLIGLLDGQRTVADAWEACNDQLGDAAPTQGEAVQLLGQLYTHNLIYGEMPADAGGMFDRYKKRKQRELRGYMTNVLFARIPLIDPDRFLSRWAPLVGWVFSPVGILLWLILIGFGLFSVADQADQLVSQGGNILDPTNLPYLYITFGVIKLIHELGHGFSVKYFARKAHNSGEVHTLGLMLMVLTPVPYVDASSASAFRSKWHRAFVGAAGMYVELAVAAIAAVVWSRTAPGAVHAIAYNAMFIASVSTLLFNANPLIRFDGYYILSDLLELPNLYQRAKDYLYYLVKRYAYGVHNPRNPAHSGSENFWFIVYGITSAIYRVFLGVGIIFFVANRLFFVGAVLAVVAVVMFLVVPVVKWVKYLATHSELARTRSRAVAVTGATLACAALFVGRFPLPDHGRAVGIVDPFDSYDVFAAADGFVIDHLPSSSIAEPNGTPLLTMSNPQLEAEHAQLVSQLKQVTARLRQARVEDVAVAQALQQQADAQQQQLDRVRWQLDQLSLSAPGAGMWVSAQADQLPGRFVRHGEQLGTVASLDSLIVRVAADQYLRPRLDLDSPIGTRVAFRVADQPDHTYMGTVELLASAGSTKLPSAALGQAGGGPFALNPSDETGRSAADPFFEVRITPDAIPADAPPLVAGQRVYARFTFSDRPLAAQGWLALRQLLQRRLGI